MPKRIFARATEPGFARVSVDPRLPGVRMPIAALIIGLAQRGRP